MDQKVVMKEEPVWLEEKVNTTLENFELVSEMKPLKQETYSDLTEPGPAQKDSFEPSAGIKEEIFVEQPTVDQPIPYMREGNETNLTWSGQDLNHGTQQ
ncbi:uncharacterized protein [Anabrus simplex]